MSTRKYQALRAAIARDLAEENERPAAETFESVPALHSRDGIAIVVFLAVLRVLFPISELLTNLLFDVPALAEETQMLLQSAVHLIIIALSVAAAALTHHILVRREKK